MLQSWGELAVRFFWGAGWAVEHRWDCVMRLLRLITSEGFQSDPHLLTLCAHYINNLGEGALY